MVFLALTKFLGHQSILFAELTALLMGLELACHMGFSTLFVESNSEIVVSWVSSLGSYWWDFGYLLSKILNLCTNHHVYIHHVYKKTNQIADFMANWVCKYHTSKSFNVYHSLST